MAKKLDEGLTQRRNSDRDRQEIGSRGEQFRYTLPDVLVPKEGMEPRVAEHMSDHCFGFLRLCSAEMPSGLPGA